MPTAGSLNVEAPEFARSSPSVDRHWGNSSSITQTIPVGADNSFSPGSADEGQPTSFSPGTNDNAFTVLFVGGDLPPGLDPRWLDRPSSPTDKKCGNDPVPIIAGTTNWTTALVVIFLALGILGVALVSWRADPELLALRRTTSCHTERR